MKDSNVLASIKKYNRSEEEEKQMGNPLAGRFSAGKMRHDLIAAWALEQLAGVYTYGCQKYDDDNWRKGLKWRKETFACILRHVWKWLRGEKFDNESGLHHLAHAAWNCFTLMEYERNSVGIDDRNPYDLDLMDDAERNRRIKLWRDLISKNRLKEYNGLDCQFQEQNIKEEKNEK